MAACRSGLERHPSYLSARVTLGRALQELGHAADARAEFEYVLSLAPDNLAAIRGLAELHGGDEPESAPAPAAISRVPDPEPALPQPEPPNPEPPTVITLEPPIRLDPIVARTPAAEPEREPENSELRTSNSEPSTEPDLAAIDASFESGGVSSAADAERAAQIERLEIWLAKLEQARESTHDPQ